MIRWLVITTEADHSAAFFAESHESRRVRLVQYEEFYTASLDEHYDVVYLRDPFNDGEYDMEVISAVVSEARRRFPSAYFVDQITGMTDIMLEDKWEQYELAADFMPATQLLTQVSDVIQETIAKKRISARARGIAFTPEEIEGDPSQYILQTRMEIIRELRVYVICGRVLPYITEKSSKTENTKVKINGYRKITPEEQSFVEHVSSLFPSFDFTGLDIAETPEGLRLIEINRSPQFQRYNERSGSNIAHILMRQIDQKVHKEGKLKNMPEQEAKRKRRMRVVVGRVERVNFPQFDVVGVPAKIDTGAYRSSIWASNVAEADGVLTFTLLAAGSEWYSGKQYTTKRFEKVEVENSFGHKQERYSVYIKIKMGPKIVNTNFTLSDRSMKIYPVLIGRKLLKGRYVVDVAEGEPLVDEESES